MQKFNSKVFWIKLDALLRAKGKSRRWLAKVTPVNGSTLNNWVASDRWPNALALYFISKQVNMSMEELIEWSIDELPSNMPTLT